VKKNGRWYCDICDKEAFVGQVSGGDRDMCHDCYENKGLKKLSRVELEQYIEREVTCLRNVQ
jgi:hypothetical protein